MNRKFRFKLPVEGVVGLVFAPIGLLFLWIAFWGARAVRNGGMLAGFQNPTVFKWAFFGFGALFTLIGGACLYTAYKAIRTQKHAFENGRCIYADFIGTEEDMHVTVNGRHPYIAVLQYTDESGRLLEFRSSSMMQDPTAQLAGQLVPVYVDRDDPENYYVDLQSVLG